MPVSPQFHPYTSYLTPDPTTYFQDNILQKYVPAWFTTGEYEGTEAYFTWLAPMLDELYQYILNQRDLPDIDRTPARFITLLSELLGTLEAEDVFDATQEVFFRRRELGKMKDSHSIRTVEYSFLRFLKYLGAEEYGLIYPYRQLMILDIATLDGWHPRDEVNDVGELLRPQYFDLSFLADGYYDGDGNLQGNRVVYTLPINVVRSEVKMFWNDVEVQLDTQRPPGDFRYTFAFSRETDTVVTNFIPLAGDRLKFLVEGDPFHAIPCRIEDAWYWRPGVTEVWCVDKNPLERRVALEDRRPIGTLLYFSWILRFFVTKCFPFPPEIDYHRNGYLPGQLPIFEELTWDAATPCDAPDPLWFQIINGYGFEALFVMSGEIDYTKNLPLEADFSLTSEMFMKIIDDTFTMYATYSGHSHLKISTAP